MAKKTSPSKKTVNKAGSAIRRRRLSPALKSILERADQARRDFRYKEAVELYTQAIDSGKLDPAREFDARNARSEIYRRLGDEESLAADVGKMIKLAQKLKDPIRQTRALIGEVKALSGKDAEIALRKALMAIKKVQRLKDRTLEADAMYALGLAYRLKNDAPHAVDVYRQVISLYEALRDPIGQAIASWEIGFSLVALGSLEKALASFEEALQIFRSEGERYYEGLALTSIALYTDDAAKRMALQQQVIAIHRELDLPYAVCLDYNNLSISYGNLGLYRRAREFGEMAVNGGREIHSRAILSFALETLARPYIALGDYEKARQLMEESFEIVVKFDSPEVEYHTYARLAFKLGNIKVARTYLQKSLKLCKQTSNTLFIPSTQAWIAAVELMLGNEKTAERTSAQAVRQLEKMKDHTIEYPPQEIWWWRYKVLKKRKSKDQAFEALQRARRLMLDQVETISDEGLRRNYLNKVEINRAIMLEWVKVAQARRLPLEFPDTRAGSLPEQLRRVTEIGAELNGEHDEEELLALILDEVVELSGVERAILFIKRDDEFVPAAGYLLSQSELSALAAEAEDLKSQVIRSRTPVLSEDPASRKQPAYLQRMRLAIPVLLRGQLVGIVYGDMLRLFGKLNKEDLNLLSVLCNQAASALENARLVSGLEQQVRQRTEELNARVDELAILNSVGEAMAKTLDVKTVTKIVGDKVQSIFAAEGVTIRLYDPSTHLIQRAYDYDLGYQDLTGTSFPLGQGMTTRIIESGKPLLFGTVQEQNEAGGSRIPTQNAPTEEMQSYMGVPIIAGEKVIGTVAVHSYRQHAFNESHVRLLQTLASNMGVAIQNARLFEAEQERNAELALINSVQEGLASKLAMQDIYDLVGDKLREIFDSQSVLIVQYDHAKELSHIVYNLEKGQRYYSEPYPFTGLHRELIRTGQTVLINEDADAYQEKWGMRLLPGTERSKSMLFVPLNSGNGVYGTISLQNIEKEHAFSDSDIRLLETLASSMSVALENARLFDETQRLLKETEQRAAELAIINSVQQGLASKLDYQGIIELVGDKIREIFNAQSINIVKYDAGMQMCTPLYLVERGVRHSIGAMEPGPIFRHIVKTRESLRFNTVAELNAVGATIVLGTENTQSGIYAPMIQGGQFMGVIALENLDSENAFSESDLRLLTTLANSMSVALENARLFDEVQKKNIEITESLEQQTATSNVLRVIAGSPTEIRPVLDAVAESAARLCEANDVQIYQVDGDHLMQITHYGPLPALKDGESLPLVPGLVTGRAVLEHRTIYIEDAQNLPETEYPDSVKLQKRLNHRTTIATPLIKEGQAIGAIVVRRNEVRPFTEKQISLLSTFADQAAIAIENVRLFNETTRLLKETEERNAELAIINSIQEGLASKLEMQAIYELVGDKISEVFRVQAAVVSIRIFDRQTNLLHYPYFVLKGEKLHIDPHPLDEGFGPHVIRTAKPLILNYVDQDTVKKYGSGTLVHVEDEPEVTTFLGVPLLRQNEAWGVFVLENDTPDHPFSDSDLRLLTTLANSMSVALENARLFDETQRLLKETEQRAAELAAISTVSQALVAETELDNMIQLIGSQMREIFEADIVYVALLDPQSRTIRFPYQAGDTFDTLKLGEGLTSRIIQSGEPLLINRDIKERRAQLGTSPVGREALSYLGVPIKSGGETIGVLSVQSTTTEDRFDEDDLRLLTTIAANAGAAIQTARLHAETQRRAQEMATLAEIGSDIAASRDLEPVLRRIAAHAKQILHVRDIAIVLREPDNQSFQTAVALGRYADQMMVFKIELGKGLSGHILQSGTAEIVNHPVNDPRVTHIPGTPLEEQDPECLMGAPLISRGEILGGILVWRNHSEGLFSQADLDFLVSVARQTAIAIESARLYLETQRRAKEMSALVDVGRDISASLEAETVLKSIASHARDLLKGTLSALFLPEQEGQVFRAIAAVGEEAEQLRNDIVRIGEGLLGNIARMKTGEIINDASADPRTVLIAGTQAHPNEHLIAVPLLASDELKGLMAVWRRGKGNEFNEEELEFLGGLARQAVIAVQNSQLFTEVKETLEQQTATSDILRVMASSPSNIQPVLDAIVENAARLCDASFSNLYRTDGQMVFEVAQFNFPPEAVEESKRLYPAPLTRDRLSSITILDRTIIHLPGMHEHPDLPEVSRRYVRSLNMQCLVMVPLMRENEAIGCIGVGKHEPTPFTEKQIALLQTFASQAVIAIENVRLFNELQQRNREITETLEFQTATSDILSIIAENPTDIQPVLDAVAERAARLCNSYDAVITKIEADKYRIAAHWGPVPFPEENLRLGIPLNRDTVTGRAMLDKKTIHIHDLLAEPAGEYPLSRKYYRTSQQRTMLVTPLVRENTVIGSIMIRRQEVQPFTEKQINLLKIFADQVAIAIENVRLFNETKRLLQETEQRATELQFINAIGQTLARELDLDTMLQRVGDKLRQSLAVKNIGIGVYDRRDNLMRTPYIYREEKRLSVEPFPLNRFNQRLSRSGRTLVVNRNAQKYWTRLGTITASGESPKSFVMVPLMAGNELVGGISLQDFEKEDAFSDISVGLLETIASNMGTAIQNVRLFDETQRLLQETEQRAAELQIINSVQEALASKLDVQAIYDLVGDKIRDIFHAQGTAIYLFDHQAGMQHTPYCYLNRRFVIESHPFSDIAKRMLESPQPGIYRNVEEYRALGGTILENSEEYKSGMFVPLMVGKEIRGMIGIASLEKENAYGYSDLRLLTTLASSMSIALENAHLFDEVMRRKEYFEALFQNNPVAVVTIDNNAVVTSWNPAAEKLFGYTREEAVGQNVDDLVAKTEEIHVEAVNYSRRGLDTSSDAFQAIVKRTRRDGSIVDVELSAVPIIVQGEKQGIYALYHDITELQRARQEAIAANEAKSSFLATMSHEIRTPMNAVIGMSGLLMDTQLNKEQREYAETIRNSGDALLAIINDILDFSKIEAGRMDVEYQPFDLRECVESALDLTAGRAIEKGLDIAYIMDDDVPFGIKSDVTRLRQILINLLSNAVKFTDRGEVVLSVKKGRSQNELLFTVRDTGLGISQENMDRLFQSFSQADSSTTRKFGGTGLGLAISKRLAEMMGGSMAAESAGIGKGSKFTFTIQAEPADVPERKTSRDILGIQAMLQGKCVLIVDDNATNRRILSLQAEKWGMAPRETEFPAEALKWIEAGEHFDLAIFDLQMPGMDGLMLSREIRKRRDKRSLPIILLTSLGRREIGAEDFDFAAYLTKPLKPSALYDALAGIFARNVISPKADSDTAQQGRSAIDADLGRRHPLRILLAEDNAVNQKLALRILEQMSYRADVASNGIEAIESIKRQTYDVILMDVQMPDMDGLDATRHIRNLTGLSQPRIIAMTANALEGDREACLAAGMDDYVSKPIRVPELVQALLKAKRI